METLFEIQSNIFDKIQKAQSNFKKSPKARITKAYLETRMENLDELWKEFVENDKKIRSTSKTQDQLADEYFVEDLYSATDELYIDYKSSLKELLSQQCGLHTEKLQSSPSENVDVKLPRIQLPIFTGKYEEWQTFHDMFTSLIHNNKSLTGVQKLHYLKTNLQGDPSNLLQNYAITESNYEEAWQQLIKQTTSSCLKSLSTMGIQTQTWDTIIIYLVASKLDTESHKQWETYISNQCDDLPTWQQMVEFLETRFRTLEMVDTSKPWQKQSQQNSKPTSKPKAFHAAVVNDQKSSKIVCVMCEEPHYLYQCKKFGQQTPQERHDFVQTQQLCFNCLAPNHSVKVCRQSTSCRRCGRKHHSLLHYERNAYQGSTNTNTQSNENTHIKENHTNQQASSASDQMRVVANFAKGNIQTHNVLHANAIVKINSNNGVKYVIRALVDQGSQASFITEETVQLLGLKRTHVDGLVSGLGDGQTKIKYLVSFQVESRHNPNSKIQINAYVLKSLTTLLPSQSLHTPDWLDLEQLTLADPGYMKPGKIDLLLGAEVYSEVLLSGVIKSPQGSLIAQNTILGWILSGRISNESHGNVVNLHVRVEDDLLKQFFELEDEPDSIKKKLTESEKKCEDIYDATTVRNKEGRYVVDLPFKSDDPECQYGQSKDIAVRKLYSLEKRLSKNPKLYEDYRKVLHEYVELGHMAEVESSDIDNDKAVYLPHHAVVKEDRETTKVRVVFNASSKGINNVSLNDDLLTGPKLQQDLRHILMRWRRHEICIVSDLVKMYRQVLVNKDHANFQRILWRDHPIEPIKHYKLLTLTFGTACAPYLAVKTLQRLAEDEQERWPIASQITKTDFYIDDLMTGLMGIPKENLYAWTDSTIVLAWLKGSPSRWATFVSNRISTILTILDIDQWGHVATDMNPADCASRGLKPEELKTHTLWWSGPAWLQNETIETGEWDVPETHEEERVKAHVVTEQPKEDFLWCKFSNLHKMLRIMSYCRRFLKLKTPKASRPLFTALVSIIETDKTLEMFIKQVQEFEFGEDIRHLRLHGFVPKKSVLHNLVPILDQNGLLRVGGRITQASVSFDKQHPIVIPEKSDLAKLLVADSHIKTLHGGPQVMLNFLRSKYWILRARSLAKKCFGSCVTCLRFSKGQKTQLMGQLPEVRLKPSKPFRSSGVDYAGPINIRFSPGRGSKSYKGYMCVFVCMVSRAIHLEAVTDLTSKGFIAAFRRFTARRGHCYDLYSDNGTNFVGANKELQKMIGKAESELSEELSKLMTLERTRWHYIVPHGPNFGGLWEAGVRCVKSHLKRVVGDSTLTYEELSTVLAQIEACLNSRPLTLLSDHPDDPLPLTPGHFLVGEPLLNIADEDCSDLNLSNLDRWKLVQQMVNRFWKRWSKEYLVNLNQRYKWSVKQSEPNINDVVIIKEDNIPPCKWLLGKIVSLHKGPDNLTRVVTVKCKSGLLKRPLSKICILTN
ncbi:hypothetical protein ABMA27_014422 [Loxostege sticticalis]|uniref:Integrase catalytic domain-containing protein n=1 Tax=Loxostege sticticalis TaxID=481309 RepID=A0ABR3I8Z7_LOXSC